LKTRERGRLTLICADLDARPLFWTEADGSRHGFEPAVAAELADRLDLDLHWRFLRWAEFVPALEAGDADAIWCGCAVTPERREKFLFSRPYAIFDESVLVPRGSGIQGSEDLRGKRVGAIAASTNMRLAESWPDCERIGFDGTGEDVFAEMIAALRRGEIDAVVDDQPAFGGLLATGEFELAFTVATRNAWAAAMQPAATALKAAMDVALSDMIASGGLYRSWNQWLAPIACPGELRPDEIPSRH